MTLFHHVVVLNNQGCYLLARRQHQDAIGQFKMALKHLRCALHSHQDKNNKTAMIECGTLLPCGTGCNRLCPEQWNDFQKILLQLYDTSLNPHQPYDLKNDSSGDGARNRVLPIGDGHYFTFSLPIPMLPGYPFSFHSAGNEKVYTAIIVFNLALTLHLRAMQSRCSSGMHHDLLKKAKKLYLRTHQLIVPIMDSHLLRQHHCNENGQTMINNNNVALDLLIMGLLNNSALIYLELFEHADGKVTFHHLLQYVRISSFRRLSGAAADCSCHNDPRRPADGEGHSHYARPVMTLQQHDDDEVLGQQQGGTRSTNLSAADNNIANQDEQGHRIHIQIDHIVNEMILNATFAQLNVMLGPAAAA